MKTLISVDSRIKPKVSDLFDAPIVVRVNKFNAEAAEKFTQDMTKAHNTGQSIIPILIDSYGGEVYSLLAMWAEIDNAKLPVATIATGKAMSCGSLLLSAGAEGMRFMDAHSTVMIHDVSSGCFGKTEEIKADAKETDRLSQYVYRRMATNCKKPPEYFLDLIHSKSHADWYLTPKDCKKHNLVNHIKMPHFDVSVKMDINFIS